MDKRYLTKEIFISKVKKINIEYWNTSYLARWEYISSVIDILKNINPKTVVEIGTAGISLMSFSDSIDCKEEYIDNDNKNNVKYIFDARETPWPIYDKKYDAFVGLQVLEHIWDKGCKVFNEIKRISKSAIITLPYMWQCSDSKNCHHMIDEKKINEYTNNEKYVSKKIINSRIELLYVF